MLGILALVLDIVHRCKHVIKNPLKVAYWVHRSTLSAITLKVKVRSWIYVCKSLFTRPTSRLSGCHAVHLIECLLGGGIKRVFVFHVLVHGWVAEIGAVADLAFKITTIHVVP